MTSHPRVVAAICGLVAFLLGFAAQAVPAAALNNVPFSGKFFTENVEYWDAAPGETKQFVVGYMNLGQKPWVKGSPGNEARLGTRDPLENTTLSSGGWAVNWTSPSRIAIQDDAVVAPGGIGYFIYSAKVPAGTPAGKHLIKARPLIEGVSWLEDYGYYQGFNVPASAECNPPASNRGCVSGKVTTSAGAGAAGVCISGGVPGCTWRSDATGNYRTSELPPGEWVLWFANTSRTVAIVGGMVTTLNITVP
jgi:hypothetical protein